MPEPRRAESTSDCGAVDRRCMPSPHSVTAARGGHDTPVRAAPYAPANRGECPEVSPLRFGDAARRIPRLAARDLRVIRDQLLAALHAALDAAGFPVPDGGVELTPPTRTRPRRLHHQRRHAAHQAGRPAAARGRRQDRGGARSRAGRRTSSGSRSRARASSTSTSRPRGCTTCCATVVAQGDALRPRRRARRPAHQPRVRVGQPDRPAARRRRPLGRGRRRDRQPARRPGRRGAPRVLPERRRQPARHVRRRRSTPRYRGEQPPEDGYQGEYLVDMADAACGPSSATTSTEEQACEWGYRDVVAAAAGRPRPHRRALRHLVLRAHAARARRGRRRCSTTSSARGARLRAATAPRGCASTDFGDQRDRVLVKSDGTTTYLCNDLAYHRDKFDRGLEHLIDIWGADHHGQVKSLQVGHGGARLARPASPRSSSASS